MSGVICLIIEKVFINNIVFNFITTIHIIVLFNLWLIVSGRDKVDYIINVEETNDTVQISFHSN